MRLVRFLYYLLRKINLRYPEIPQKDSIVFKVPGAGYVAISEAPNWQTGGVTGFDFAVSWGKHGYAGGVLGRQEAERLVAILSAGLTQPEKPCDPVVHSALPLHLIPGASYDPLL